MDTLRFIFLSGLPGCGKTTLINYLMKQPPESMLSKMKMEVEKEKKEGSKNTALFALLHLEFDYLLKFYHVDSSSATTTNETTTDKTLKILRKEITELLKIFIESINEHYLSLNRQTFSHINLHETRLITIFQRKLITSTLTNQSDSVTQLEQLKNDRTNECSLSSALLVLRKNFQSLITSSRYFKIYYDHHVNHLDNHLNNNYKLPYKLIVFFDDNLMHFSMKREMAVYALKMSDHFENIDRFTCTFLNMVCDASTCMERVRLRNISLTKTLQSLNIDSTNLKTHSNSNQPINYYFQANQTLVSPSTISKLNKLRSSTEMHSFKQNHEDIHLNIRKWIHANTYDLKINSSDTVEKLFVEFLRLISVSISSSKYSEVTWLKNSLKIQFTEREIVAKQKSRDRNITLNDSSLQSLDLILRMSVNHLIKNCIDKDASLVKGLNCIRKNVLLDYKSNKIKISSKGGIKIGRDTSLQDIYIDSNDDETHLPILDYISLHYK